MLSVVTILLMVTTFIEKYCGTVFVSEYIYGSWWFVSLWAVLTVISIAYIFRRKLQRNFPAFLLHLSFVVILAGALLTHLTARQGTVHLRIQKPVNVFTTDAGETVDMPFAMTLDTFYVSYYPGTNAAADYVSRFTVTASQQETFGEAVSMNKIFSFRGMRFYQSSYDSDECGSLFSVNYDRWGIPVTYAGYFLLFASMVWSLLSRKGYFRRMLQSALLKKGGLCVVAALMAGTAGAAERTLSRKDAAYMGEAQVLYNGRIAPIQTLAYDFTTKLTGKSSYGNYTAEQVFLGWLLFPSSWTSEPMIRVKDVALRRELGFRKEYVSLKEFFTPQGEYLLDTYLESATGKMKKAAAEADEKVQLLTMLHEGELFKAFPVTADGRTVWYSPSSTLPVDMDNNQWLFIRKSLSLLCESVFRNDTEQIRFFISKLIAYQQKNGGESVLPARKVAAERLYNCIPFSTLLYRLNLTAGLLAFFYLCFCIVRHKEIPHIAFRAFVALLWVSFLSLTCCLSLRGYISGRLPMSNGYETMMTLAWCILPVTLSLCRKFRFMLSFGFLLSGFCLLVASIGQMNPQITPLMPVLVSPLLSLHVSLIMMSYALFSFTFLNAILAFILPADRKEGAMRTLQDLSRLLLVPALFLLGAGIFIGAIWANVSWGRYWAWDPKEVWALITFLLYAFALHADSLPVFRHAQFFHAYMLLSFLAILMTYYGVNYFLGGMHSYA